MVKNPYANAGDLRDEGSIPELGRSPREGNGNPLQYSCLEKSHGPRSLAGYSPCGLQKRVRHDLGTKQQKFFDERSCPMHCKISRKKKKKKRYQAASLGYTRQMPAVPERTQALPEVP